MTIDYDPTDHGLGCCCCGTATWEDPAAAEIAPSAGYAEVAYEPVYEPSYEPTYEPVEVVAYEPAYQAPNQPVVEVAQVPVDLPAPPSSGAGLIGGSDFSSSIGTASTLSGPAIIGGTDFSAGITPSSETSGPMIIGGITPAFLEHQAANAEVARFASLSTPEMRAEVFGTAVVSPSGSIADQQIQALVTSQQLQQLHQFERNNNDVNNPGYTSGAELDPYSPFYRQRA